jgi:MFS family permease
MSIGSIVLGGSLLLLAGVRNLPEFYAVWGLGIGLGTALTYYPVSFTVVANWFDERRMQALSTLTFMGAFSSTLFYPLNGALVNTFGWREGVAILGALQLALTLPLHAIVVRQNPVPPSGIELGPALRTPAFWLITAAISLSFFASTTVLVEHIAYLISRGYAPTLVSASVGLFGVAYLPGRFVVAYAGRRIALRFLISGALVLEGVGIVLLILAYDLVSIFLYIIVFGAAYGALAPLRAAIMAEQFGRRSYGAILAAQGIPIAFLAALGPFIGGRLIDVFGYGASFGACIGALLLAALVILIRVR